MLKMGGMCHCAELATLWKIDPSDGTVVWKSDRRSGMTSVGIELYEDGSDLYIFEAGQAQGLNPTASSWSTTKWLDGGSSPTREWDSDEFVGLITDQSRPNRIAATSDGNVVIAYEATDDEPANPDYASWMTRLDGSDGSEQVSLQPAYGLSDFTTIDRLNRIYRGNSGEVVGIFDSNLNTPQEVATRFNSSLAGTAIHATMSTSRIRHCYAPKNGNGAANGYALWDTLAGDQEYAHISPSLVKSVPAPVDGTIQVIENSCQNNRFLAMNATQFRMVDSTNNAIAWTVSFTTTGLTGAVRYPTGVDANHDAYIFRDLDGEVKKITSGGEQWSTDCTGTARLIVDDANSLVIVAGTDIDIGSDSYEVVALNMSDGSVAWATQVAANPSPLQGIHDAKMHGGYLYVCGSRM